MNKKYKIIYADPPWSYEVWSKKGKGRSAENHYKTMDGTDILNIPVKNIADDNCVLFLWATYPCLPEAFKTIEAWGFKYKTVAFTWVKTNLDGSPFWGLGYWTRANAEICLLATKGNPKRINKSVSQIILERPKQHSRKPDEARNRIVELMGDLSRIELFARYDKQMNLFKDKLDGWDVWGNEVKCDINL